MVRFNYHGTGDKGASGGGGGGSGNGSDSANGHGRGNKNGNNSTNGKNATSNTMEVTAQTDLRGNGNQRNGAAGAAGPTVASASSNGALSSSNGYAGHWRLARVFNENDEALINRKLPKELLLRIFSHLDVVSLCRCAQVSKAWNVLALDGSNWQKVDLFDFQVDIEGIVVENIARR